MHVYVGYISSVPALFSTNIVYVYNYILCLYKVQA